MAATRARVARGTTLALKRDGGAYVTLLEMVKLTPPEVDNGVVDATHLASDFTAREFLPQGFTDHGRCGFVGNYYTDDAFDMLDVATDQETSFWKITIPDRKAPAGADSTIEFEGFLEKYQPVGDVDTNASSPLQAMGTIKITGKITFVKATV